MRTWQLQNAKAKLSELVKQALSQGPQEITLHGEPAVIVISKNEFERLSQQPHSFSEFMKQSPLYRSGIKIKRDKSLVRSGDLFEENE